MSKSRINLSTCDQACTNCHLKYFTERFQKQPTFDITCGGIPLNPIPDNVLAQFSSQDQNKAIGLLDPVVWAKDMFNWEARWYQKIMLLCSAKKMIARCGRRTGKSETIAIRILHSLSTKNYHKCLVVCPFKAQTEVIFDKIKFFINKNPSLANSVKRVVASPYPSIEMHNGSYVRFFTAGTKSSSGAEVVRGQPADEIFLDEADYLAESDVNAVLAIMTEHPRVKVWASSTPSGARQHFYNWSKNPSWKEFHFPSMVLPHWNAELEKEAREYAGTDMNYRHEYAAEWSEQAEGVYQKTHVENAQVDYRYEQMVPQTGWTYCAGVDWNDSKVGTEICVVGWNPDERKHYIVNRSRIDKAGWTQTRAMETLINLNRHWNPKYIYIDKGFGGVQYEILQKFGWDALHTLGPNNPDSRFREHMIQYDFGGKVTIHDLHTKQQIEKDAKPFLVNNSARCFEKNEILYSKYDKEMTNQLHGYIVDRISAAGKPVYKASDKAGDHGLDALNLALVAFKLNMTDWGQPNFAAHIGFSGNFGDKNQTKLTPDPGQIKVIYDPEYEKQKKAQEQQSVMESYSRTKQFNPTIGRIQTPRQQKELRPWTVPGFSSDTEWKHKKKQMPARTTVRGRTIPLERNTRTSR